MERVDSIRIESEDDGFHLIVDAEDGTHDFNIHGIALELEAIVRRELRPYALEAEHARQAVARGETLDEYLARNDFDPNEPGAYSTDDPKRPDYHDMMADLHDSRKGK